MDDAASLAAFQNPSKTLDAPTQVANNTTVVPPGEENTGFTPRPQQQPMSYPQMPMSPRGGFQQFGPSPNEVRLANEAQERARIISRLQRLNARPDFPSIQFSESDNLTTLRKLNKVATHAGRAKMTVSFMKRATIFIARIMEGLCERFPNRYLDLEGYSEFLMLNISQYDALLYDIFEYYSDTIAEMSPILAYVGAIGSNLVVYSISRKLMGKSSKKKLEEKRKEEQEKKERERAIQEMLKQQQKRNESSSMTGPGDDDFRSVATTDSKRVTFDEKPKVMDDNATVAGSPNKTTKITL
jgi:hypothetical protein